MLLQGTKAELIDKLEAIPFRKYAWHNNQGGT